MTNTGDNPPDGQVKAKPTIETVHVNIKFANEYRQEFIKSLTVLSGGLFAFSVAFRPELHNPDAMSLFWVAWIGLALSMLGGFVQLGAWERYYKSFRDFEYHGLDGKPRRALITLVRRAALILQVVAFIVGTGALGIFTAVNLERTQVTPPATQQP